MVSASTFVGSDAFAGYDLLDDLFQAPALAAHDKPASRKPLPGAATDGWDSLSEPLQLTLAGAALRRAAEMIAQQAEALAGEIDAGFLRDHGGPEALRMFAAIIRVTSEEGLAASVSK